MKRLITEQQEQILRACHCDFDGLTQAEAADKLGISQSTISNALKHIEEVMPDFFPILTKLEAQTYHLFMSEGWNVDEIAEYLDQSANAIYKTLRRTKDKGMFFTATRGRVLQYESSMDVNVKEQF